MVAMKEKTHRKKRSIWTLAMGIFIGIFCLSYVLVVFWAFLISLKTDLEYISGYKGVLGLPEKWLFSNYVDAFKELETQQTPVFMMLGNSVVWSVLPPIINLLTASMASYVMAKYKFPLKDFIWTIMIFMMILPIMGNGSARYVLMKDLGLYDSPLYLLTNITGLGGSMMIIAAFKNLSTAYMDAAFIEGAGHFTVFFKIMLPQITGLLTALYITSFIAHWNDYMTAIMYLPSYIPITTGLYLYQESSGRTLNTPVLFAGTLMVLAIPVMMFFAFNEKFSEMNFGGGIKG